MASCKVSIFFCDDETFFQVDKNYEFDKKNNYQRRKSMKNLIFAVNNVREVSLNNETKQNTCRDSRMMIIKCSSHFQNDDEAHDTN
jgi:hypothetical protein